MPSTTTTENHSLTYPAEGATGWYATWEALMQQITDYMDDITNMRMTSIKDDNGNEQVVFTTTASAVNHLGVTNAATGNMPELAALGDDSNVDVKLTPKGSGVIDLNGPVQTGALVDDNNNEYLVHASTSSAVNHVNIVNAATGNSAIIEADGSDTNVGLDIKGQGTGEVGIFTNGNEAINVDSSGVISQALQPSFLGQVAAAANSSGDGTVYALTYSSEIYDVGANNATATFTAPVTGKYVIQAYIVLEGLSSHTYGTISAITSNRTHITYHNMNSASGGFYGMSLSITTDMDAADTVSFTYKVLGGAKVVDLDGASYVSIHKLS